jgi:hypothetical protein
MTGRTVNIGRDELISFVHDVLNEYKMKKINGDPDPRPNPFTESLFFNQGKKTLMVPHDIQNQAISLYLENDDSGVFDDVAQVQDTSLRNSLRIESDEDGQVYTNEGEIDTDTDEEDLLSEKSEEEGNSTLSIVLMLLMIAVVSYYFYNNYSIVHK